MSWPGDILISAAFVLCIGAITAGPLIAPAQRRRRRHRPAWARSRIQARRIARQARRRRDAP